MGDREEHKAEPQVDHPESDRERERSRRKNIPYQHRDKESGVVRLDMGKITPYLPFIGLVIGGLFFTHFTKSFDDAFPKAMMLHQEKMEALTKKVDKLELEQKEYQKDNDKKIRVVEHGVIRLESSVSNCLYQCSELRKSMKDRSVLESILGEVE
jgi:hypothetical protein